MTAQPMDPKEVLAETLNAFKTAGYAAMMTPGAPGDLSDRYLAGGLAAVIPAIRAQAIADAYNEVTKLHDASTYQDGYGWFERAAYANVLDALTRIARGDQ